MALIITRRFHEVITLTTGSGEIIEVKVVRKRGHQDLTLAVEAPRSVKIFRGPSWDPKRHNPDIP